tara:strand:+ start:4683 stop:5222 length:540 start_codon:yes stop_codon:yes gene_type:complete
MVLPKKTTRELIGDYIDLDIERQMVTDNEEQLEVEAQLQKVQGQIRKKVDGIDHFMLELSRREHLIDAEIEAIKSEQSRLRVRKKAVEGMKDYFNKQLLPMIVDELGDENGVYETGTARYKLYETYGPVVITNPDDIPDAFKKVEMVEKIDKKEARKVLTQGNDIPGFYAEKVKRVRRS